MSHDQLSKSLIETFFTDFLDLIAPDSAARLHPGELTFLDKELFTDWPTGDRRELDLLARVLSQEGDAPFLIHVEIESEARSGMDLRLWLYYMQLRVRHGLPVLPILLNLRGGTPGVGLEILEEGVGAPATATFRYRALGLSGCRAEDWLPRPEPLAWAFAALMRPGKWSRAELKIECLRRIARSDVSGLRKEMLVNWVETYVELSEKDVAELRRLLELEDNREVATMELTWLGKAEARGFEQGRQYGVDRMRQAVLRHLERQFGVVPERVHEKVEAMDSIEPLAELIEKVPLMRSVDDLD